jgi:hypothetical protein
VSVVLALIVLVFVMVPWSFGWLAMWDRYVDPWLRRRLLTPALTSHVYTPHRVCEGVCRCGWPLSDARHLTVGRGSSTRTQSVTE